MKVVRKDSLETKRRLVDSAERMFAEQGIDNVKLVDVSRQAGQKNRNAAQYHFGDRAGLINAVLDKHSSVVERQRGEMLDSLEKNGVTTMRELVEALVTPVVKHVHSDPMGLTYLLLNRQLVSTGGAMKMGWRRLNDLPDARRMQRMMGELMPTQRKSALQAKMILVQCMLFNGLANYYDLHPAGDDSEFVNTLCASLVAVLMESSGWE